MVWGIFDGDEVDVASRYNERGMSTVVGGWHMAVIIITQSNTRKVHQVVLVR